MTVCRSAPGSRRPVAAKSKSGGQSAVRSVLLPERTANENTHAETDSAEHDRAVDNVGDGEAAHGCRVCCRGGRVEGTLHRDVSYSTFHNTEIDSLSAHLRTRRRVKSSELS